MDVQKLCAWMKKIWIWENLVQNATYCELHQLMGKFIELIQSFILI